MTAPGDDDLYVYALAAPGLPPRLKLQGRSLRIVPVSGIHAIVERGRVDRTPTADALRAQHDLVVSLARRVDAILPARFGSVVSEAQLESIVSTHHAAIQEALALVRGCDQMTIRVFGTPPPEDDRAADAGEPPVSGTAFLHRRRERAHAVPAEVADIRAAVADSVAGERIERGAGTLLVTVFHLVPRGARARYEERASSLQASLAPRLVRVSGPWPPFAFAPDLL